MLCEWCPKPIHCATCPPGTYHMHKSCYSEAVSNHFFAKVSDTKQEFPVSCQIDVYHFVLGTKLVAVGV